MEPYPHSNREYEKLSKAIIKAISSSRDVKSIISNLKEKGATIDKSVLVFMLELGTIMAFSDSYKPDTPEFKTPPIQDRGKVDISGMVDGRKLTQKEMGFYQYSSKQFNEEEWLRKNGIIFDKD